MSREDEGLVRDVIDRVAGRWALWALFALADETPLRFTDLKARLRGITQKVLTLTVRTLERDGLVTRTVYRQVPPRVDYALTAEGRALVEAALPLWLAVARRAGGFAAARARFDPAQQSGGRRRTAADAQPQDELSPGARSAKHG